MSLSPREAVYWIAFMAGVIVAYLVLERIGVHSQIVRIICGLGAGVGCGFLAETVYVRSRR